MNLPGFRSSYRSGYAERLSSRPRAYAVLSCLILGVCLTPGIYPSGADAAALNREVLSRSLGPSPLTEEQRALHVLNRLAFGPKPGDVEKVKSIGLEAYITQQLDPGRIDDSALEKRLTPLETIRMDSRELARTFPRPGRARKRNSGNKNDENRPELKAGASGERREMDPEARKAIQGMRKVAMELSQAKILRAVYSERQLQEVMTDFWFNHFNVFIGKGADRILTTNYERDVIRPNSLGKFHTLLLATAKSPAMLFYLDNWMSADPNARMPDRMPRGRLRRARSGFGDDAVWQALARQKRPHGLNENYARELLELHTLGVDGGYTQRDVMEVARCFTGWTLRNPRQGGGFQFVNFLHDNGEKVVLGKKISAGEGMKDGLAVLEMVSKHPSTAHFISIKLCRRFVSDNPPESLVKRCADRFLKTDGDIRQVLETIFTAPEFYSKEAYRAKTKKPFELVASALRATGAEMIVPPPRILFSLRTMGEMLYGCQPPTGYPDTAEAWINTGALLERVNFAAALASGRLPGVRVSLDEQQYAGGTPAGQVPRLARAILYDIPGEDFVSSLQKQLQKAESDKALGPGPRVTMVASLILGSPEFQKR